MNKGFTMIELLAAIIILSGIMLIAIPSYTDVSYAIKVSSLKNKTEAISSSMLKFASSHLIDDIKPSGNTCNTELDCCMYYDLYNFIIEYGIYALEKEKEGEALIIDPMTNDKLIGVVRIKYNKETYELDTEFIKDKIINTPQEKCKG